jgi:two-component system chemotaxis sensor kinase CheA
VKDDGAGIDWEAVARRASTAGLAANTPDDLLRALLGGGISTTAGVTDTSGRGVGMTAVAEATRALGGDVSIETARGAGTTVRLTFPLVASGFLPAAMRAA